MERKAVKATEARRKREKYQNFRKIHQRAHFLLQEDQRSLRKE